jgi:hypothetical protein
MKKPKRKQQSKNQVETFRKVARELGTDENEAKFNEALRKVAAGKPGVPEEVADALGQSDPNKDFGKAKKG